MNSQMARKPDQRRPARSAKSKQYVRQTAHVEARRDGTPLIFGWGSHLSRSEKTRIQRRAIMSLAILIAAIIIGVVVFSWINITVIIPNQPISSVNGQNIPQSDYHKLVVFKAQWELNKLKALQAQGSDLSKQIAQDQNAINSAQKDVDNYTSQLKTASDSQKADIQKKLDDANAKLGDAKTKQNNDNTTYQTLQSTAIPNQSARYTQSQLSGETANWLQEDILIRNWLTKQSSAVQKQVEPGSSQIDRALQDFKKAIPSGNNILSSNGLNDNDVRTMMTLKLRRDNLNTYLMNQYTSPMRQVHVSSITAATQKDATDISKQLQGKSLEDFAKLAQDKSQDTNTKGKGGDLGWLIPGQYTVNYSGKLSGKIDNWIFDSARKVGDVSPVLMENGSYYIIRIDEMQASRDVDKAVLDKMRDGSTPIDAFVQSQRSLPGMNITAIDQAKLLDTTNMPQNIPYAPSTPTPAATS